jgi:hypothetical protein
MQREVLMDMFNRIPEMDYQKVQIVMASGSMLSLDTLIRFEPLYLVMRGREAGNQDEGRAFFIPYEQVEFLKIERIVALQELEQMFADRPVNVKRSNQRETRSDMIQETPRPEQQSSAQLDPAAIAKQNLLDRIRAAKSIGTTAKSPLTK